MDNLKAYRLKEDDKTTAKRYVFFGLVFAAFVAAIIGLLWFHGVLFSQSKPTSHEGHDLKADDLPAITGH